MSALADGRVHADQLPIKVEVTGTAGSRFAEARIQGLGARGRVRISALYIPRNAGMLRRFVKDAHGVVAGDSWHATLPYGGGAFRIDRDEEERLRAGFRGRRGGVPWRDTFTPDAMRQLLTALEAAAAHITDPQA